MLWRISVNNLWIADLAIFREWINNDQRATTTPLLVGIETCSLKYFTDTKFVYRQIVELLVFAWTNIVTHLLQEFSFSENLSALIIFNFWSASHVYCTSWETFVSSNSVTRFDFNFGPIECSFDCVSLIFLFFLLLETYRVTTTDISPGD